MNFVIIIFHILSYAVFYFPFRVFGKIETTLSENIKELKKGVLLIANHQNRLDPFIVLSQIPFITFLRILPIRYPVCNKYMSRPFFSLLLKALGCYNIGTNAKESMLALVYTRKLLQKGTTVFLFPEGKISRTKSIKTFKKGIEFIIGESQNVVFVRLRGFNKMRGIKLPDNCSLKFSPVQKFNNKNIKADYLKKLFDGL